LGAHRYQVGDLIFTPRRIVNTWALGLGSSLKPAPIDRDGGQLGGDGRPRSQSMVLKVFDLLISALPQLLADFMGYPSYLTAAHRHFGQIGQGFGSVLE
jgi:hypothetical protein